MEGIDLAIQSPGRPVLIGSLMHIPIASFLVLDLEQVTIVGPT